MQVNFLDLSIIFRLRGNFWLPVEFVGATFNFKQRKENRRFFYYLHKTNYLIIWHLIWSAAAQKNKLGYFITNTFSPSYFNRVTKKITQLTHQVGQQPMTGSLCY